MAEVSCKEMKDLFQDLADSCKEMADSYKSLHAMADDLLSSWEQFKGQQAAGTSSPTTTTTTPPPTAPVPPPATPKEAPTHIESAVDHPLQLSVVPALSMPAPAKCSTECQDIISQPCEAASDCLALTNAVTPMEKAAVLAATSTATTRSVSLTEVDHATAVQGLGVVFASKPVSTCLKKSVDGGASVPAPAAWGAAAVIRVPPRPPDLQVQAHEGYDALKFMESFLLRVDARLRVPKQEKVPSATYVAAVDTFATNKAMTAALLSAKRFLVLTQFGVLSRHTRIKRPPWPPPGSICIQNIHQLDVHDSSQVTELFLFCSAACSIPNLHCTMDTKQLSGDRLISTTMELQWNATFTVINFDLGVQCVQLQPTVFKWSDHSCYDTHYLLASANVNMMLDFLLVRRAACTLGISCCLDNLHCSLGITTLSIPDWVMFNPWPPPELEFFLSIAGYQATILTTSMVLRPTGIGEIQPWAHPFGIECEHLHWPCFQPTICHSRFSDAAVHSLVHAEREGWFQFGPAGKASLYSYGTAQFQWEFAWQPTTLAYSRRYGMHMYLTLECFIVICYLEIEIKCAVIRSVYVPHLQWDPAGFTRHWLGVKTKFRKFACLLVGSYWASSESERSEMVTLGELSFWRYAITLLNQMMLNVYHTFSPRAHISVGLLNDVLVQDWLLCLHGQIIQHGFEVDQWKIAWSFNVHHSSGGNKFSQLSYANRLQGSLLAECVKLGHKKLSWHPGIWAFFCFYGLFTHTAAQGGITGEAPTYRYNHCIAIFLGHASSATTTSSALCKSNTTTSAASATDTTMTRTIKESRVPWDPGGSTWHRLGVKPNFKEGRMSCAHQPDGRHGKTDGPKQALKPTSHYYGRLDPMGRRPASYLRREAPVV